MHTNHLGQQLTKLTDFIKTRKGLQLEMMLVCMKKMILVKEGQLFNLILEKLSNLEKLMTKIIVQIKIYN